MLEKSVILNLLKKILIQEFFKVFSMKKLNIAIIPARGGSKRLPNKNILDFCGNPLIIHSVNVALESSFIDQVIITTDSEKILRLISDKNYPEDKVVCLKRPSYLATDTASQVNVIEHVVDTLGEVNLGNIILLQPTSPLRTSLDINQSYKLFLENGSGSVVSFGELNHPTEYSTTIPDHGNVDEFIETLEILPKRSQDFEQEYILNGAIYIFSASKFMEEKSVFIKPCNAYIMPYERSFDIDEEIGFRICEYLAQMT